MFKKKTDSPVTPSQRNNICECSDTRYPRTDNNGQDNVNCPDCAGLTPDPDCPLCVGTGVCAKYQADSYLSAFAEDFICTACDFRTTTRKEIDEHRMGHVDNFRNKNFPPEFLYVKDDIMGSARDGFMCVSSFSEKAIWNKNVISPEPLHTFSTGKTPEEARISSYEELLKLSLHMLQSNKRGNK